MEESSPYIEMNEKKTIGAESGVSGSYMESIKLDSGIYYIILIVLILLIYSAYSSFCSNRGYDSDNDENFIENEIDKLRELQDENLA